MTSPDKFHPVIKFMHGLMAIAMIAAIAIILYAGEMPRGPEKFELYFWHKSLGLLLAALIIIRIVLIKKIGKPAPIGDGLKKTMASVAHGLLYLAMLALPFSGLVMSYAGGHSIPFFGLFEIPGAEEKMKTLGGIAHEVHEIGGNILIGLIVLHVVAALYHHFGLKDDTMRRMFGHKK
ncbi:cytochrome b [Neiella marina]|uniref:Cytochrome b n=1 Tax=Neiella holothuriorum TaxID=2870530 RepID=A0ABS7EKP6_9GAMM|nr:cytochrome b [Neiella holothuriorum]MBW8192924.1 cytochrome b [Neiella holothuriorum]